MAGKLDFKSHLREVCNMMDVNTSQERLSLPSRVCTVQTTQGERPGRTAVWNAGETPQPCALELSTVK